MGLFFTRSSSIFPHSLFLLHSTYLLSAGTCHEINFVLLLFHSFHILVKTCEVAFMMRRLEAKKFSQPCTIGVILNNAKLYISTKLFPECVIVFFFCNFLDHIKSFANKFLSDHLKNEQYQVITISTWKNPQFNSTEKDGFKTLRSEVNRGSLKIAVLGFPIL